MHISLQKTSSPVLHFKGELMIWDNHRLHSIAYADISVGALFESEYHI